MKHHFLILAFIISISQCVYTQELEKKTNNSPEITLSLNRTTVADGNVHNRFGFGAGFYYPFFDQKRCNLIVGLEYNKNSLLIEYMNTNGKWGGGNYNTTYTINNIGVRGDTSCVSIVSSLQDLGTVHRFCSVDCIYG